MPDLSYVYVLTNKAMPGFIKVGMTTAEDVNRRMRELYSTGVPLPFTLEYACRVANPREVESALLEAFAPQRPNPNREFLNIEPNQAITILRLLHTEEATDELSKLADVATPEEKIAVKVYAERRPNLNFEEMQIPMGAELTFTRGDATVVVAGPRKVRLGEEEMSLTAATRQLLSLPYSVQPSPYWMFNGRLLSTIYNETYTLEA